MNIYGIPIIVSYSAYMTFLSNFSEYSVYSEFINSSMVIPLYIFINFVYLWFMFKCIIPFLYKSILFVKNSLFR